MLYNENNEPLVKVNVKSLEFAEDCSSVTINELIPYKENYTEEELSSAMNKFINDAVTTFLNNESP